MKLCVRVGSTMVLVAAVATAFTPSAAAGGKASSGCSPPYELATITQIEVMSQPLVDAGFFTPESLEALLVSIDHNSNSNLCFKVPSGWLGPPATNGASRAGFVNLVDDKIS